MVLLCENTNTALILSKHSSLYPLMQTEDFMCPSKFEFVFEDKSLDLILNFVSYK